MNDAHSPTDSGHAAPITVSNGVNGDATPELVVNGDDKQLNGATNGINHGSPSAESPATPVSTTAAPDVKIDIDYQEQESDARHEPMPIKPIDAVEKPDPASEPTEVPSGNGIEHTDDHADDHTNDHTDDVHMAEPLPPPTPDDIIMGDAGADTPATTPGIHADVSMMNLDASSSYSTPAADDQPPPAKRARMHSDADKASLAHSATPPPASAVVSSKAGTPMPPPAPPPTTLSNAQFRFCQSTIRSLKKVKDASPFLRPVDPVALNIPHYPSIIKTPMDFSTIERKLASSNPLKPDPNPHNARYYNADEFITDVRLIFQNCLTFNGPDHLIVQMGKRVEQVFDKQIKQMPPAVELKPVIKKVATPPPPPPPPVVPPKKTAVAARRPSTSVPVIRRSDTETIGRPKREIHPPPPKDLSYADAPKKHRKGKRVKDDGTNEQLKFCSKLLFDLNRKQCYEFASPFYEPVDWVKLELPSYPRIVKKPMDLSTMRKKLDSQQYPNALKFFDDFKLMIRNCFLFNPAGTPVNQAGIELQRLFDEKWKQLPPLREVVSDDEEDEEEDDSEEERQRMLLRSPKTLPKMTTGADVTALAGAIALMESQIETMRGNIAALKGSKAPKEKKKKEKREKPPVASSSKSTAKPTKTLSKKKAKKPISDNDVLTFEQKKDLSECIAKLDEIKLEKVIQIIHEGVPEIRDSTDEIELEIDSLPAAVLTKLYNFVLRPLRAPATKRNRPGKGTGTGGLKRKSMDEDVEAEKIRMLEERMALFDRGANGGSGGGAPVRRDDDSDHSSDSSSNSDSSGSDSE